MHLCKHTLIVNSVDRVAGDVNSFAVKLPNSEPDASKIELTYFRGPNLMFNITPNNNKINFNVGGTDYIVEISPGAYTADQLLTSVGVEMNAQFNNTFVASYNVNTLRTSIVGAATFTINWSASQSIGLILGYTTNQGASTAHVSDRALNLAQPYFIYLTIKGYSLTGTDTNSNNFHFYIPVSANTGEFIDYEPRRPQSINISGLKSRLEFEVTSNGPFDLNTGDWSAVFEVKNSQLKDSLSMDD
jgi:hypothetical protein